MKIISQFKDTGEGEHRYLIKHTKPGDVILDSIVRYIRTAEGFVSEFGYAKMTEDWKKPIIIKPEAGDLLEKLLIEAEKRCDYEGL